MNHLCKMSGHKSAVGCFQRHDLDSICKFYLLLKVKLFITGRRWRRVTDGISTHALVCFRYLSGSSFGMYCSGPSPMVSESSTFIPTPPPNLAQLLAHQQSQKTRRASPSSLPGRLNRALSLGTMPSLARQGQTVFCLCAFSLSPSSYLYCIFPGYIIN